RLARAGRTAEDVQAASAEAVEHTIETRDAGRKASGVASSGAILLDAVRILEHAADETVGGKRLRERLWRLDQLQASRVFRSSLRVEDFCVHQRCVHSSESASRRGWDVGAARSSSCVAAPGLVSGSLGASFSTGGPAIEASATKSRREGSSFCIVL